MPEYPDPWPLRHLVLRTPRLELRPDDDAGLLELAERVHERIHPPDEMPFANPFTDADPADVGPNTLRFYWQQRAECRSESWSVNFLVRLDGTVIGTRRAKLGYERDGTNRLAVRGQPTTEVRLLLTRERFAEFRPSWQLETAGTDFCMPFLAGGQDATKER